MGVVPENRLGRIEFYEAHQAPWAANAAAIGLTPASVIALGLLTGAARSAYNAHNAAQEAARAATRNFYDRVRTMHNGPGAGADMIQSIKNYAESKNDPNVYVLAQVPPPAIPGTTPPPGTPFDFNIGLLQNGSLELKWKCNNPGGVFGTIYEVKRKVGAAAAPFTFVGASGVKTFTDETLPVGATPCTYQITAVRSTSRGNPAQFTVNFGVNGGSGAGLTIESVTSENGANVKLAA